MCLASWIPKRVQFSMTNHRLASLRDADRWIKVTLPKSRTWTLCCIISSMNLVAHNSQQIMRPFSRLQFWTRIRQKGAGLSLFIIRHPKDTLAHSKFMATPSREETHKSIPTYALVSVMRVSTTWTPMLTSDVGQSTLNIIQMCFTQSITSSSGLL